MNQERIIFTNYEELCTNTQQLIEKIKQKIPELDDMENKDWPDKGDNRHKKITDTFTNRIIEKDQKNEMLKEHLDLLSYFNYNIL